MYVVSVVEARKNTMTRWSNGNFMNASDFLKNVIDLHYACILRGISIRSY